MNSTHYHLLALAEDSEIEIVCQVLKSFDQVIVTHVGTALEALDCLWETDFFLAVFSRDIPEKERLELESLLRKISDTRRLNRVPILLLEPPGQELPDDSEYGKIRMDFLQLPLKSHYLKSRIRTYLDLHTQRKAVEQSIAELDNMFHRFAMNQDMTNDYRLNQQRTLHLTAAAAKDLSQPLRQLTGSVQQLDRQVDIPFRLRQSFSGIRSASNRITNIIKSIQANMISEEMVFGAPALKELRQISTLAVMPLEHEFNILSHAMKGVTSREVIRVRTVEEAMETVSSGPVDLVFISDDLPGDQGYELLEYFKQGYLELPVIYTVGQTDQERGVRAISKGAYNFLARENISSAMIWALISGTFEKAAMVREIEDAQSRITMISRKDPLTRLNNRECFDDTLDTELAKSRRYHLPLSILMMDFDDFKQINQTHGFLAGNQILTTSASIIKRMVRGHDVVCRYGGEEFGVVLPNTSDEGARVLADRIRNRMKQHDFYWEEALIKLTVSVGLASFSPERENGKDTLVKTAVEALTKAMNLGGDQVVSVQS